MTSGDTVFTVSQLTALIKELIEGSFPSLTLEGEISNFRPNTSGHLYFTLKDSAAQISAVMFKSRAASLTFRPKDGMKVKVKGSLSVYQARGNYQIIITSMQASGEGDILLMLEERKRRLSAEGLFDSDKKKPLPRFPRTIGVITSSTGAALHDILQITHRRNSGINVVILPATVQGEDAAQTIIRQIKVANLYKLCDVLIVGRGGGSLEDLLPFSDEGVVRTIAASQIPIVSAVGHEIDWAISDFAADMRAPTPSAAAELVTPIKSEIADSIRASKEELYRSMKAMSDRARMLIESFNKEHMELQFRAIEQPLLARLDSAKKDFLLTMQTRIENAKQVVKEQEQILDSYSPTNILSRGYSVVKDKQTGKIIRSAKDTAVNSAIEITSSDGIINATVTGV